MFYFQVILCSVLLFHCSCIENASSFYVRPTKYSTLNYFENDTCEELEYYLENKHFLSNLTLVNFKFLPGVHNVSNHSDSSCSSTTHLPPKGDIELVGLGPATNVTISGLCVTFTISGFLLITNLTIMNSGLYTYQLQSRGHQLPNVIVNIDYSKLNATTLVFSKANISIEESEFYDSSSTAIKMYHSSVTFKRNVSFVGNIGYEGGALVLVGSKMYIESNSKVLFSNNRANRVGGAIYVANSKLYWQKNKKCGNYHPFCFYILKGTYNNKTHSLIFVNNTAEMGGDHIYGALLKSDCISTANCDFMSFETLNNIFLFEPDFTSSLSVSSDRPSRVCMCDKAGYPLCANQSRIFWKHRALYPGIPFNVSVAVVGGDFGTTSPGAVHASIMGTDEFSVSALGHSGQRIQVTKASKHCTNLEYSILSNSSKATLQLTVTSGLQFTLPSLYSKYNDRISQSIGTYFADNRIDQNLRSTPVFMEITLLPCPPGFMLMASTKAPKCVCYPQLKLKNPACSIDNLQDNYNTWNSKYVWFGTKDDVLILSERCPFDYCKYVNKGDILSNLDSQCSSNRAGQLCGNCNKGYSLAIGSSHCIKCNDSRGLSFFIFFAVAGILLVIFISGFNLTITQGMINGLIFYANIVWTYKSAFFNHNNTGISLFFNAFIAWLNLDFGIETCFFVGLDGYSKAWLQFVFPLYLWIVAGIVIIVAKKSSNLTKVLGNRAVPTLDTLFLLSYIKVLRTIIDIMQFSVLISYEDIHSIKTSVVWSVDGHIKYFGYKHAILLMAALVALFFLWLPYTFLLLFAQLLRKLSHYGCLKWVVRLNPVFDTHFAPLKDQHNYWFGVLLLVRVFLFMITISSTVRVNLLILLLTMTLLLVYMATIHLYKSKVILINQSVFFVNLIGLSAAALFLFADGENKESIIAINVSVSVAFFQFVIIAIWSEYQCHFKKKEKNKRNETYDKLSNKYYRDSILNELTDY